MKYNGGLLCYSCECEPVTEGEQGQEGEDEGRDGQGRGQGDGVGKAGLLKCLRGKVASIREILPIPVGNY